MELYNEDALDFLADIIEPASRIFSDKKVREAFQANDRVKAAQAILKGHDKDAMVIIAATDKTTPDKCKYSILDLFKKLLEILNDKDIMDFLASQAQMEDQKPSGPATVTTKGTGKKPRTSTGTSSQN